MRISNAMIYNTNLKHMQTSLSDFMETTIQGGTQKKINRPSDDPAGAALVLNSRAKIEETEQYQRNVDTARGWLELTDGTLQQVSSTIAQIKTLTEQAATGTMTAENRQQIAYQVEELFGTLLNLSNVEFEDNSIFGGHNPGDTAFEEGLGVMTRDPDMDLSGATVTGKADKSMTVRFLDEGVVGIPATAAPPAVPSTDLRYEWSKDGGATWTMGTLEAGETSLNMEGVTLNLQPGTEVQKAVTRDDEDDSLSSEDHSFLYIYPTAVYQGDDSDDSAYAVTQNTTPGLKVDVRADLEDNVLFSLTKPDQTKVTNPITGSPASNDIDLADPGSEVYYWTSADGGVSWQEFSTTVPNPSTQTLLLPFTDVLGNNLGSVELDTSNATSQTIDADFSMDMQPRRVDMVNGENSIALNAQGIFSQNTTVRIDEDVDLAAAGSVINYSYSNDGGQTWIKATSLVPTPDGDYSAIIAVPGGFLELSDTVTHPPATGTSTELAAGTQMVIHPDRAGLEYEIMENSYVTVNQVGKDIFGGQYDSETVTGPNLFETVGKLIAFLENNESNGIAESLVAITEAHEHVLTQNTRVGGLVNRLDLADSMLDYEKLDQEERLSYTEDIDLTELLNNLAKDELTYSTVLQTSSMILQLNLTKFI